MQDKDSGPTIFVVSNRLPITIRRSEEGQYDVAPSSGGLVGAFHGLSQSTKFKWYGWPGLEVPEQDKSLVKDETSKRDAVPVFLGATIADKHYNGFSNKILWPLLHYQMHEIHLCQPDWESYQEANKCFAESLIPALREGDCVWIQDYHLMLLPSFLRQALKERHMKVQIGFFLHTVFPASDFFRILPVRKDILRGLLNCDLVGFHNSDHTEHFLQCCRKIMGLEVSDSEVSYDGRIIRTSTSPIGIDPEEFHARLKEPKVQERAKLLNEKYKDMQLIVSIDRLDYIKGIPLRLDAIDTFLTKHPEYVGKVVLLQLVIPSREEVEGYQRLHDNINERVSGINSKFGDIEFNPVQLQFSSVSKDELTALYAASDACIVSSTRDGFNIVSLEYIACQQDRHGVLLLSEFAGAAQVLEDCIKFNPWDVAEFSDAIFQALTMSEEEKRMRFDKLHSVVMTNTR